MTKYTKNTYLAPHITDVAFRIERGYEGTGGDPYAFSAVPEENTPANTRSLGEHYSWSSDNDKSSSFF